jgi:hypothetical protein
MKREGLVGVGLAFSAADCLLPPSISVYFGFVISVISKYPL